MNIEKVTQRLSEARDRLNYNQAGIAAIAGVSQRTFSSWENGVIPGQWDSLVSLAKEFRTSTDYLLGLTDDPRPLADVQALHEEGEPYQTSRLLTDEERALLHVFGGLNDWRQRELVFIAQGMASAQRAEAGGEPMADLFDHVEDVYGVEMANRLEHAMSVLTTADVPTLRRVIELLESLDQNLGDAHV